MAIDIPLKVSLSIEEGKNQIDAIIKGSIDKLRQEAAKGVDIGVGINIGIKGLGELKQFNEEAKKAAGSSEKLARANKQNQQQLTVSAALYRKLTKETLASRDATRYGSEEWNKYNQRLKSLQQLLNQQSGIQRGSITVLRQESAALQQNSNDLNLNEQQRRELNDAIRANAREQRNVGGALKGSLNDLKSYAAELRRARDNEIAGSAAHRKYAQELNGIERSIDSLQPKGLGLFRIFGRLAVVQAGLTAITAAFTQLNTSLNFVTNRQKQVEGFKLSLQAFGFTQAEVNRKFQEATNLSLKLGVPLQQVEGAYKRMAPVLQAVGISAAESDKFIANVSARTQILGLNSEESGRLLEAFSQVLSKGKLQAEELNQQISELDGAFRVQLAGALGIATEDLADFVKEGNVTAPVFVKAVNKMENGVALLEARIKSGNLTLQQFQNIIGTLNTKNLEIIGQAFQPAIRATALLALEFTKFVQVVLNSEIGKFISQVFAEAIAAIANFLTVVTKAAGVVVRFVDPLFALLNVVNKLLGPIGGLGAVLAVLATRMLIVKAATALANIQLINFTKNVALASAAQKAGVGIQLLGRSLNALSFGNQAKASKLFQRALQTLTPNIKLAGVQSFKLAGVAQLLQRGLTLVASVARIAGGAVLRFLTGPIGIVVTIVTVLYNVLQPAIKAIFQFGSIFGQAENDLKKFGITANDPISKIKQIGVSIVTLGGLIPAVFNQIGRFFNFIGKAWKDTQNFFKDRVIETQLSRIGGLVDSARAKWKGYGDILGTLGDLSGLTEGQVKELSDTLKILANSTEEAANALEQEIIAEKNSSAPDKERIERLEEQKRALDARKAALDENIKKVNDHARATNVDTGEVKDSAIALEKQAAALAKAAVAVEAASYTDQVKSIKQYSAGLISAAQLALNLAAINLTTQDQSLKALNAEIKVLEERFGKYEKGSKEAVEAEKELNKKKEAAREATLELANAEKAYLEAVVEAVSEQVTALQGFADKASEIANQFQGLAGDIRSSASGAIQAFSSLADIQAEIAIEQGADPVAVAREVLAIKQRGIEAERAFNEVNIIAQAALKKAELEIQKIRLETEARLLEIQGRSDQAARLRELIPALDSVGRLIDRTTENQLIANNASAEAADLAVRREAKEKGVNVQFENGFSALQRIKGQQDRVIANSTVAAQEAETIAGAFRETSEQANTAASDVEGIRQRVVSTADAARDEMKGAFVEASGAAQQASTEIKEAVEEGTDPAKAVENAKKVEKAYERTSISATEAGNKAEEATEQLISPKARRDVKNLGDYFLALGDDIAIVADKQFPKVDAGLKSIARSVKSAFSDVPATIKKAFDPILDLSSDLSSIFGFGGVPARWMGGPVSSGQTYRINDGGGREGFLSSSGRFSMLPAMRNINWTAPSSGVIIPAPNVEAYRRGVEIRNQVSLSTPNQQVRPSSTAVSATLESGNLLRQIKRSSDQGSTTQRITNNVTIQSQNPVMDASRLMIDLTKSRMKRRPF